MITKIAWDWKCFKTSTWWFELHKVLVCFMKINCWYRQWYGSEGQTQNWYIFDCQPSHYNDSTALSWHINSLASWLFVQQPVQGDTKTNIKALHCWPLKREIHQWLVDSPHKWPVMQNTFPLPWHHYVTRIHQWPLLLTWFNFNPSMDK